MAPSDGPDAKNSPKGATTPLPTLIVKFHKASICKRVIKELLNVFDTAHTLEY